MTKVWKYEVGLGIEVYRLLKGHSCELMWINGLRDDCNLLDEGERILKDCYCFSPNYPYAPRNVYREWVDGSLVWNADMVPCFRFGYEMELIE